MDDARARADLRDLVDDHLSRNKKPDLGVAAIAVGLAKILEALNDAQEQRGNWGGMIGKLKAGQADLEAGLSLGAELDIEAVRDYARRQATFAALVVREIERLQAEETTLV
jgi:hypothetical protein